MFLHLFGCDGSEEQQPEPVTVHFVHSNLSCTEIFGNCRKVLTGTFNDVIL